MQNMLYLGTCFKGIYVPTPLKEHIANEEQIVYSGFIAIRQGVTGRRLPRLPNPGHKEHDNDRSASCRRRIVHGQNEGP